MKYHIYKNSVSEYWYKYGTNIWHREAGAARIYSSGYKVWWQDHKRHREVGPAVIGSDGREDNWIKGVKVK